VNQSHRKDDLVATILNIPRVRRANHGNEKVQEQNGGGDNKCNKSQQSGNRKVGQSKGIRLVAPKCDCKHCVNSLKDRGKVYVACSLIQQVKS
jgi:hypothetical protein